MSDGFQQNTFGVTDMHRVALALRPLMEERFSRMCTTLLTMLSGFSLRFRAVLRRISRGDHNTWSCAAGVESCAMRHLLSRKLHAWRLVQTVFPLHRLAQVQNTVTEAHLQDQDKGGAKRKVERHSYPSSFRCIVDC